MGDKYDFSGWATKYNIKCADGRTIREGAFKEQDGKTVPLVWQHQHDGVSNVLGHALLEYRPGEGMYTYGSFNDTLDGMKGKELVTHGDITSLSIYANQLKQTGGDVMHGAIREVSLVLAGANVGAVIDNPVLAHGDGEYEELLDEAIIYSGLDQDLAHAEDATNKNQADENGNNGKSDSESNRDDDVETVQDVFDSLTDKQKKVVYYMIDEAVKENDKQDDAKHSEENGGDTMHHNVFDKETVPTGTTLSHADMETILADAKRCGSLKDAVLAHMENGVLAHTTPTDGMEVPTGENTYGFRDPEMLFPEAKSLTSTPEWIKRDTDWVSRVVGGARKTPFSRIKSVFADITEDDARAKGYIKGNLKTEEVFTLLKRSTTPQTIYKKQKLDRDDVLDITDFDVVAWIKSEMNVMLDEEKARAILIGDGRLGSSDDKISEDHIRPIVSDKPLFTIQAAVPAGSTDEETAKNVIRQSLKSRKDYKGSGNPTLFITEEWLTNMLLIEDDIGHRLYKSEAEVATACRVKDIVTVPVLENFTNADGKLVYGIIVNMADYTIGADKGGQTSLFEDFDIDYNQQKYLIETRMSGALTKPFSAIVLYAAGSAQSNE